MKKIASCATALVAVVPATIGLGDKTQADRGWHHGWGGGIAAGIVGGIVMTDLYRPYYYAYGYPYYYANGYPYYNHGSPWYYRPYTTAITDRIPTATAILTPTTEAVVAIGTVVGNIRQARFIAERRCVWSYRAAQVNVLCLI
jgi:hypothetical protein